MDRQLANLVIVVTCTCLHIPMSTLHLKVQNTLFNTLSSDHYTRISILQCTFHKACNTPSMRKWSQDDIWFSDLSWPGCQKIFSTVIPNIGQRAKNRSRWRQCHVTHSYTHCITWPTLIVSRDLHSLDHVTYTHLITWPTLTWSRDLHSLDHVTYTHLITCRTLTWSRDVHWLPAFNLALHYW